MSPIQIIVRMLEPDCFLEYRMHCNAEFYYVGKIPHMHIGTAGCCRVCKYLYMLHCSSEAWFKNDFIHCEPWEHVCLRYVCSTECLLVIFKFSKQFHELRYVEI